MRGFTSLPWSGRHARLCYTPVLAIGLAALCTVSACGGGSSEGGAPAPIAAPSTGAPRTAISQGDQIRERSDSTVLRGLRNNDATCYLNATLQLIVNKASLRAAAERLHPNGPFADFFSAYDSPDVSDEALNGPRDAVVHYLRTIAQDAADATGLALVYVPEAGAGDSANAMSTVLGSRTFGAPYPPNAPYIEIAPASDAEPNRDGESEADRDRRHAAVFVEEVVTAARTYFAEGKRAFGFANLISHATMARIASGVGARITGLTFYQNGHFIAYVRKSDQWYRVDDSVFREAPESEVDALPYAFDLRTFTTTGHGSGISTFALE